MAKSEIKRLLRVSREAPVNCAVGLGDGGAGLLILDKIKQPRALEKMLVADHAGAKNTRWGTAAVDPDNPKLVRLTLNRAVSGMARRLIKTLKGTWVNKVIIGLEDGSTLESEEEPDEDFVAEGGEAPAAAAPPEAAPPSAPPPDPAAGQKALTARLEALIKHIPTADPAAQGKLTEAARRAGAAIKSGDLAAAVPILEAAEALADAPGAPAAVSGDAEGAVVRVAKGLLVWNGTRSYVEQQVRKLTDAILAQTQDEEDFDAIRANLGRIDVIMDRLDDRLSESLDALRGTQDPGEKTRLSEEARKIIADYQSYVATDPLMADIDDNGFIPLDVKARLTTALDAVAKIV